MLLSDAVLRSVSLALCAVPQRQLYKAANLVFQCVEQAPPDLEPLG